MVLPGGLARYDVLHEYVKSTVVIADDEVRGIGMESDEAAIVAERGLVTEAIASTPPLPTLTRVVTPAPMSRTKTSSMPLVSPGTRFEACERRQRKGRRRSALASQPVITILCNRFDVTPHPLGGHDLNYKVTFR